MLLGCTWSVEGSTGCYLVEPGQCRAVLVGTWWYWVRTGGTGCQCEKMYGLHDLNHQIIEYSEREKSDYEKMYRRTEFPLVDGVE